MKYNKVEQEIQQAIILAPDGEIPARGVFMPWGEEEGDYRGRWREAQVFARIYILLLHHRTRAWKNSPRFLDDTKKTACYPEKYNHHNEGKEEGTVAKSKYETHVLPYLDKIVGWVTQGATEQEVADKLGIAYSSLKKYLALGRNGDERYAAFSDAFARSCIEPDDTVEASLYKLACGYNATVVKHYKVKISTFDPQTGRKIGEREELVEAQDEVHVPANVAAQMFWLANRRRDRWQYKPEGGEADEDGGGVVFLPAVKEQEAIPDA